MAIEEKLDKIIEILLRIEEGLKINADTGQEIIAEKASPVILRPTKSQLKFKRVIELANSMDRTHFFSSIRKNAVTIMERKKSNPAFKLNFTPQLLHKIDEKIAKTQAQFYKDLKDQTILYANAVEREGEAVLQRAINRLTVRAK